LIGRLVGKIVEDGADGAMVLDVNGVGYELTVPLGTVGRILPDDGGAVTLFVHTHVREDALLLYGFASLDERAVFRQLISVSNIGPKLGMNILGAVAVPELAAAVQRGETVKLQRIPGVGKKTAERIVLELKDKLLAHAAVTHQVPLPKGRPTGRGPNAELVQQALTRMGYRAAEAERAVTSLGARLETEPLADLVRDALAALSA
jgi:Holliday junction DNA helicase RuvA